MRGTKRPVVALCLILTASCPAPSWQIEADLPASRTPEPRSAWRYSIRASQEPELLVVPYTEITPITRVNAPWQVTLFEGETLAGVAIGGECSGGCTCEPPEGAHVRVDDVKRLDAWIVGDTRDVSDLPRDSSMRVTVRWASSSVEEWRAVAQATWDGQATERAIRLRSDRVVVEADGTRTVSFKMRTPDDRHMRLRMEGLGTCEVAPCAPNNDAAVRILSVATEENR